MQRQLQQQRMQPPGQGPLPGTPVGQPGGPQQPPVQRMMNGPMAQRLSGFPPMNGPMPNGVSSSQLQPGQMTAGPAPFPNMGGPGPQPNGIPGSGPPPQAPGTAPAQPQNFQTLLPNQRTIGPPGHQQSPQHHAQPPAMSQLSGPSPHMPHMNRPMPPPMNPLNPGVQQPGNATNPSFPQLGRPPSRANTPGGQSSMLQPSPSLSARQPPGGPALMQANQELLELRMIPAQTLAVLRQELGLSDREPNQMTPAERVRRS